MAYRVLTFDCYGTLIDWESGIWAALEPLLASDGPAVERGDALAAFGELESAQQAAQPDAAYPQVLAEVHRGLAERFGRATTPELDERFGAAVGHWPAFPDSPDALRTLKGAGLALVILSNVDRGSFALSQGRLGVEFDAIYTAQDIGSYKPSPANFTYLIEHVAADFGADRSETLHVAQSVFHDLVPGAAAGLDLAWIDRQGLSSGGDWGATARVDNMPDVSLVYPTLAAFAADINRWNAG